jgi:hypothetical protein
MRSTVRRTLIALATMLALCVVAGFLSPVIFKDQLVDFLTLQRQVNGEFLVVEGWVDDLVVDRAAELFRAGKYSRVITTGSPIDSDYLMATDGLLEYQLEGEGIVLDRGDTIRVRVRGPPMQNTYPFFSVVLNDRVVYEDSATSQWNVHLLVLDSLIRVENLGIFFGNDDHFGLEDRNLLIRNVEVGGRIFPARSPYSFQYDRKDRFKEHPSPTDFNSVASTCAYKLVQHGIPPGKVTILPSGEKERNRTLASALAVRRWLEQEGVAGDCSLDVVSESIHSRRTYILYNKALKRTGCQVGIIPVLLEGERYKGFTISRRDIAREMVGSLYYRFLFNTRRALGREPG